MSKEQPRSRAVAGLCPQEDQGACCVWRDGTGDCGEEGVVCRGCRAEAAMMMAKIKETRRRVQRMGLSQRKVVFLGGEICGALSMSSCSSSSRSGSKDSFDVTDMIVVFAR